VEKHIVQQGAIAMDTAVIEPRWKDLHRLAGIAAIISMLIILLGFVTYFIWPYSPRAESTEEILRLLQRDKLGRLVSLDIFLFIGNLFSMMLFLALYVSLKQVNESYALISAALGLVGPVLLIPARPISNRWSICNLCSKLSYHKCKNLARGLHVREIKSISIKEMKLLRASRIYWER
jgi:hypothetical protein